MKTIPNSKEERLELPETEFADPELRRFAINSTEDLEKLPDRVRNLENKGVIIKNAVTLAKKNNVKLPEEWVKRQNKS